MKQPFVYEDIAAIRIPAQIAEELRSLAAEARQRLGGELVTVSLWRSDYQDLVRVFSNQPEIYRPGGISRELGADWVRKCVVEQVSFLAENEDTINSDAFENHDVLSALGLGAAINAVITDAGEFLGCLNLLDRAGAYSPADVAVADTYARKFAPVVQQLQTLLPAE
ncbi:GAF domain-containing protein [Pseudarthrobacter cellobiosi]|uniref:GAF domain-containing protein n=1 Tax=Pseudarthrobacter cellobiosi TaxID=2953654 RepID=UPI00208EC1D3|nr:GAF domain-containing protein [Pseudarthrobacter sp. HLT1-5]MCO4253730.1 hypothetical protein [Pseudarthrobacter sp. HLT1-5]